MNILALCMIAGCCGQIAGTDDLVWHRLVVGEFTILSLNKDQGEFVAQNASKIKQWSLRRWGLPNPKLASECRLLCVYDTKLMQKLFLLNESKVEWRDKEQMIVGWLLLDGPPITTLPEPITEISLIDLERQIGKPIDFWAKRGIVKLNNVPSTIKSSVLALDEYICTEKRVYFAQTLFVTNQEKWLTFKSSDRRLFDIECMVLCLMLRKNYGQNKFNDFMFTPVSESMLIGYPNMAEFNKAYIMFLRKLCDDVVQGRITDSYFEIK